MMAGVYQIYNTKTNNCTFVLISKEEFLQNGGVNYGM